MQVSRKDFKRIILDDTDPDLSWIGEFTDECLDTDINRDTGEFYAKLIAGAGVDEDGNSLYEYPPKGREYRSFRPAMTGEETGNPDSPKQDYELMEAYDRGEWNMIGIRAQVTLEVPIGSGVHKLQPIESGGLYGIESDSGESYFDEVHRDECAQLEKILTEMGLEVIP